MGRQSITCSIKRIDQQHVRASKVGHVAGHHGHAVFDRGGGNHGVTVRTWVGHMHCCAQGRGVVGERQDAARKNGANAGQPDAPRRALRWRSTEWLARQRRKIEGGMAEMARLVGQRQWAVGEAFSLGDIAVGTAVEYLSVRFQDMPWRTRHPDLAVFCDRLAQRPPFKESVPVAQTILDKVV